MKTSLMLDLTIAHTPVGPIGLYGLEHDLVGVTLDGRHGPELRHEKFLARHLGAFNTRCAPDAAGAATRLERYFAGEFAALDEQPLRITGTAFQRRCWTRLRAVKAGETLSYAQLAAAIDHPTAVRAVAAANGANILALFIPCHRVIAADGTLWGYGGGLPMKQWLLQHERARFTALAEQGSLPL
ncbi:MAG: methylated-DNA--[protein]-cysteine S-methyltransferase [Candidatus Eisenbacteria bacterium]